MRKRGIIILFFLAGSILIPARTLNAARLKLLGGVSWGKYAVDWDMTNRLKPGYLFGLGVEGGVGSLNYEVDILYFLKTNSYISRGWDYELGEISVPFMAKIKLFSRSTPFLLAGGEVAYILSHKQKPGVLGEDSVYDMMDNTRKMDYGLIVGIGYELKVGGVILELSGRYHYGLAKVSGLGYREYEFRTRELAVALGLLF
jgi:hypothetical protein